MYNSLSALPFAPYSILKFLALNNENIWKMIKYNSYDALSKPNLTIEEKLSYVWKSGAQEEYSVFLTNIVGDAICEEKCVLKCYDYYISATDIYISTPVFAFDFLYGVTMALVEKDGIPVNRGDLFIHEILSTLNGVNINGIGKLMFNNNQTRYDFARSVIADSKKFTGVQIYLSTNMGDSGSAISCVD